jgi:hypothetical protein
VNADYELGWLHAIAACQKMLTDRAAECELNEDAAPLGNPMKSIAFGGRIELLAAVMAAAYISPIREGVSG